VKFNIDPKSINYLETSNGMAFHASLCLGNMFIGTVYNQGEGGGTSVDIAARHVEALNRAAKDAGYNHLEFYLDSLMNEAEGVSNDIDIEALMKGHSK
jgi:hypothetical protein